jgi:hypothetical protein
LAAEWLGRDVSVPTVNIVRLPMAPMDGGKPWQIVLDKTTVGWIKPAGRDVELKVDAGRHSLRLERSRLLRSATRSFELRDGQAIAFSCTSKPYRLLFPLFWPAALVRRDTWISLRRYEPEFER